MEKLEKLIYSVKYLPQILYFGSLGLLGYDIYCGVINDTASVGTICSLLTARENYSDFKSNKVGLKQNNFRVYCSNETHSSIEKAVKLIGIGSDNLIKIESNKDLSMNVNKLENHRKVYEERFANPFVAAEKGFIDEVIMPRNTRRRISRAFASLRNKKLSNPLKKHDNIPL